MTNLAAYRNHLDPADASAPVASSLAPSDPPVVITLRSSRLNNRTTDSSSAFIDINPGSPPLIKNGDLEEGAENRLPSGSSDFRKWYVGEGPSPIKPGGWKSIGGDQAVSSTDPNAPGSRANHLQWEVQQQLNDYTLPSRYSTRSGMLNQYVEFDAHWERVADGNPIQNNFGSNPTKDGKSDRNKESDHGIKQTVSLSRGNYLLLFDYRGRVGSDSNQFKVSAKGERAVDVETDLIAEKDASDPITGQSPTGLQKWKQGSVSFSVSGGNPADTAKLPVILKFDLVLAAGKKADSFGVFIDNVILLPVEFKKMWETPNMANQIVVKAKRDDPKNNDQTPDSDGNTYGTPRYLLYVTADPSDAKYHVSVDVQIGMRDQFVCAAYKSGTKVNGTDKPLPAAADQPADLLVPASGSDQSGEDFVIKIAFDANKNGLIDSNETLVNLEAAKSETGSPAPPMVRGFSPAAVTAADSTIQAQSSGTVWNGWTPNFDTYFGIATWFVPNAIALERLFYSGESSQMNASYQPTATLANENIDAFGAPGDFNEWLTHHTGATFNAAGVASIKNYKWNNQTRIASLIAAASPFSTLYSRASLVTQMQNETAAAVEAFKQSTVSVGQTQIFPASVNGHDLQPVLASLGKPHWSPSWVPAQTLLIGDQSGSAGTGKPPDDANSTVGRSRFINGTYWFVLKKENRVRYVSAGIGGVSPVPYTAVVVYLRVGGTSQDLYDFNHNAGGLSVPAAITQLSYGNGSYGRTHGIIYRTTVDILKDYEMKEVRVP